MSLICSETCATLIPRAYIAMIFPSISLMSFLYFGTTCGSKSLFRSCGTWIGISPMLDRNVFGLYPFRLS